VRVSSPDRARDAIDLVAPTVDALAGIVEHAILGEHLVDGRAPARGIIFTDAGSGNSDSSLSGNSGRSLRAPGSRSSRGRRSRSAASGKGRSDRSHGTA